MDKPRKISPGKMAGEGLTGSVHRRASSDRYAGSSYQYYRRSYVYGGSYDCRLDRCCGECDSGHTIGNVGGGSCDSGENR